MYKIVDKAPELEVWEDHSGRGGSGIYTYTIKGRVRVVNDWIDNMMKMYPTMGYGTRFWMADCHDLESDIVVYMGDRFGSCD